MRQQVRLLTTALLKEIRVSTSVGGGGRERRSLGGKRPAKAGSGNSRDEADELGTRRKVTPTVARYQEHVGPELRRSAERQAIRERERGATKQNYLSVLIHQAVRVFPGRLFHARLLCLARASKLHRKRLICRGKPTHVCVVIGTESLFCPCVYGTKTAMPMPGEGP